MQAVITMVSLGWVLATVLVAVDSQGLHTCNNVPRCVDCNTLLLCSPQSSLIGQYISTVDCSQTSLPYCDYTTGTCSATPSPSCAPKDSFSCLSDGYFPDPTDCRSFHLCVDLVPTHYTCDPTLPTSYYYNVVLHRCAQSAVCGYSCVGKTGVKVAHPADKNLFAYCYNGTAVLQDRCPGNYELDESSQQCEAVCKTTGLLVDLDHCNMYYRCISQNYGYWRRHEQCPQGQGFNPLSLQCDNNSLNCSVSSSTTFTPSAEFISSSFPSSSLGGVLLED